MNKLIPSISAIAFFKSVKTWSWGRHPTTTVRVTRLNLIACRQQMCATVIPKLFKLEVVSYCSGYGSDLQKECVTVALRVLFTRKFICFFTMCFIIDVFIFFSPPNSIMINFECGDGPNANLTLINHSSSMVTKILGTWLWFNLVCLYM